MKRIMIIALFLVIHKSIAFACVDIYTTGTTVTPGTFTGESYGDAFNIVQIGAGGSWCSSYDYWTTDYGLRIYAQVCCENAGWGNCGLTNIDPDRISGNEACEDADSDGIPDSIDLDPNVYNPYEQRLVTYWTDDGTEDGDHVFEIWQIKNDDGTYEYVYWGTDPEDGTNGYFVDSDFSTPTIDNTPTDIYYDDSGAEPSKETVVYDGDGNTGDADEDGDTDFTTGDISEDGDTDSESLGKIVDNTAGTNSNIERLGDYLNSMNESLQNIDERFGTGSITVDGDFGTGSGSSTGDFDTTAIEDGLTTIDDTLNEHLDVTDTDVSNAEASVGNLDTEYTEATTTIVGDASLETDAPEDYQEKFDITTKLADYISNNPISDIITNSGVTVTGATSSASFTYANQSIDLTVSGFDTELNAFGSILVSIAALYGMLLVVKR